MTKVESSLMTINRWIHGKHSYKMNRERVCKDIGVDSPRQEIIKAGLKFLHKVLVKRNFESFLEQIIIPNRAAYTIYMKVT